MTCRGGPRASGRWPPDQRCAGTDGHMARATHSHTCDYLDAARLSVQRGSAARQLLLSSALRRASAWAGRGTTPVAWSRNTACLSFAPGCASTPKTCGARRRAQEAWEKYPLNDKQSQIVGFARVLFGPGASFVQASGRRRRGCGTRWRTSAQRLWSASASMFRAGRRSSHSLCPILCARGSRGSERAGREGKIQWKGVESTIENPTACSALGHVRDSCARARRRLACAVTA